ncbi:LysR substrate-binding domain-containing protein [Flaviflagellibacter deserti]|jgi:DNA-binding transcriptional LysR family regulator|uniref:LysR substrate-binding domain-containing protein n=1 Tax=Flaviflagellibacter deserti TaxID=2267266 RepID=A0ABV9Z5D1_9HYPH
MLIRQLHYLTALARERHFARAAASCNVTQPTLSAGIKQIEETLGVLVVERGHRFIGFTAEGERVLAWAQRVLADYEGLTQDLGGLREGLVGRLQIGVIPVALPLVHWLTEAFAEAHPRTTIQVLSQTSAEIQRGLDAFELDAGVTYLDNEPLARVRTFPLYEEHYVLVTPAGGAFDDRDKVTWEEAAGIPLGLLTNDMQNRRILDMHFREAGQVVRPVFETNSPFALLQHLTTMRWSTVLPHTYLAVIGELSGMRTLKLVEPDASHQVGLVVAEREPLQPLARALRAVAAQPSVRQRLELDILN